MGTWDNKGKTGKPVTTDIVRSSIGVIASRIDNIETALDGTDSLTAIDISGGNISGTTITGNTIDDTNTFGEITTTAINIDNIKIDGNTISSTDEDGNIELAPDGDGEVVISGKNFNTNADGDVDCTDITCNSIATGNEAIKFDVISGTAGISTNATLTIAHNKSTNIRGCSVINHNNASQGILITSCNNTNVYVYNMSASNITSGAYNIVIFYV